MNALALFLALVLQGNPTCHPEQPVTKLINGESYRVQTFQCYWRDTEETPSHTFEVWSPVCKGYIGQPILVSERNNLQGWAMNEFGEFYPATTNVDLMYVYHPDCSS